MKRLFLLGLMFMMAIPVTTLAGFSVGARTPRHRINIGSGGGSASSGPYRLGVGTGGDVRVGAGIYDLGVGPQHVEAGAAGYGVGIHHSNSVQMNTDNYYMGVGNGVSLGGDVNESYYLDVDDGIRSSTTVEDLEVEVNN